MQDTGFSSSLERCGDCSPPLLRRLAASLHPDSRTLYPESGNKEQGLGKGESKNQGTGYGVRCLPLTKDSPLPFPDSGILLYVIILNENYNGL